MAASNIPLKHNPKRRLTGHITSVLFALLIAPAFLDSAYGADKDSDKPTVSNTYFKQYGTDPAFSDLLKQGILKKNQTNKEGVKGSRLDLNNEKIERGPTADNPIPKAIKIHTLANSAIQRDDFPKWTRWYQEDGNTQVFRLFKGEHNVRNTRPDAGRVEAFSELQWKRGDGWHKWEGTYTILKPHSCMIFQVKNQDNDWAVAITMNDKGDIKLNHRRDQNDIWIARGMAGKPFVLTVRDDGHDYEVYYNRKLVGAGSYNRPKGMTSFRWGMYGKTFEHDALLCVTGATFE